MASCVEMKKGLFAKKKKMWGGGGCSPLSGMSEKKIKNIFYINSQDINAKSILLVWSLDHI